MKVNKTLNELRQTKDSYYEVPNNNKKYNLEEIVNAYNSKNKENVFNSNQVKQFLDFIKVKGYSLNF
tara:strand:- start:448 stop:648 length:201 start_codon:yes stop_codon:yes gene_type:complete